MSKTTFFIPTLVGPSKLDKVLAYCVELNDDSKQKVCLIQDIAKLGKLLGHPPMLPENFYAMYDMPTYVIEQVQHSIQVEWNTKQYHNGFRTDADF